jgi:hypothetical protein
MPFFLFQRIHLFLATFNLVTFDIERPTCDNPRFLTTSNFFVLKVRLPDFLIHLNLALVTKICHLVQ